MGTVLVVWDRQVLSLFALKSFRLDFARSEKRLEMFRREAIRWVQIGSHRNVVQAIAVEIINGRPFIVLEYVKGSSLRQQLGRLAGTQVLDYALQICAGMAHVGRVDGQRGTGTQGH